MSRPHSARERKVGGGTGKTNAIQPGGRAPPVLKQRPQSAQLVRTEAKATYPSSQDGSLFGSMNQYQQRDPTPREEVVTRAMQTPFYSTLFATAENQPRKTFLPPSRFPTVPIIEPVPASRYKRPPIAPQWYLEQNAKPTVYEQSDFRTDIDIEEKAQMVDEFLARNKYRMALFNYSYKGMKLKDIREEMMSEPKFLHQMTTYAYRERSYVSGTSSARMKSLIDQSHQEAVGEVKDPFLTSIRTSRVDHNKRLNNILAARNAPSYEFTRGFQHAPEYGNFSNFNSILKQNENSVLKR